VAPQVLSPGRTRTCKPSEERRRAEKAAQARLENQVREIHARRLNIAAEIERLGVSSNIELDERAGLLCEQIASLEEVVAQLSEREAVSRSGLAALEETLKQLRMDLQGAAGKAVADRVGVGETASRAEVPG